MGVWRVADQILSFELDLLDLTWIRPDLGPALGPDLGLEPKLDKTKIQ